MKKTLAAILAASLLLCLLTACGSGAASAPAENGKPSIVVTIFPEYDWVRNLLGDRAADTELTLLLDNGVDLHSYQPTADDIIRISTCDLFIYVGGESDAWVDDALQEAVNPDMIVLNLLDILGDAVVEEELVEGREAEDEGEEDEEGPEYDEHVWLSLQNTRILCAAIADALAEIDPDNADVYAANAANYDALLAELDARYAGMADSAARNVVLFGDRFPFRYLADDYDLDYYAAFVGCSAETEASFETVAFLAGKVDELALPAVLTIESSDHSLAQTIVAATADQSAKILSMDSMQGTTSSDIDAGATYLSLMEQNLSVLSEALN